MKEKFTEAGAKRADRIIEGNTAIINFLTTHIDDDGWHYMDHPLLYEIKISYINQLRFHISWDHLVPVVQKIFSLPQEEISPLDLADVNLAWNRKDITEIWESCVKFIKKYQDESK